MKAPSTDLRTIALISVGGATGTLVRYAVSRMVPVTSGTFPTTTLVINVTGALILGVVLGALGRFRPADETWRPLVGVGFLGAYTTFSTFAVETTQLIRSHHAVTASVYVLTSVAVGLLAARAGEAALSISPEALPEDEM